MLYVCVYTPLNAATTLNTAIGSYPGASLRSSAGRRPPAGRASSVRALFLIVFLWQFPHFLAIAWIYREDYARGDLKCSRWSTPTA